MRFHYGEFAQQFGDLYKPEGIIKPSVVIVVHGGYWKDNHTLDTYATRALIPVLLAKGIAVWNIEYRRMESTGENLQAPWPVVFCDVANAVDYLKFVAVEENLDITAPCIIGHSAGATLALWAAYRRNISPDSPLYRAAPLNIAKAISIAGVVDLFHANDLCQPEQLSRLLGGTVEQVTKRYHSSDPCSLYHNEVLTYLYHGGADPTVNVQQVGRFVDKHPQIARLMIDDGADHFSMLPHTESFNAAHWKQLEVLLNDVIGCSHGLNK